jgi:hypothetical protein
LHWPYPNHEPPWDANPKTIAYKSLLFIAAFDELLLQRVPGLGSETFQSVFATLQNAGCLLYPHGGCVRDYLLGLSPKDIDVEYSCEPSTLDRACVAAFGADLCYARGNYFRVGEQDERFDELEGVNWNGTIFWTPVF